MATLLYNDLTNYRDVNPRESVFSGGLSLFAKGGYGKWTISSSAPMEGVCDRNAGNATAVCLQPGELTYLSPRELETK